MYSMLWCFDFVLFCYVCIYQYQHQSVTLFRSVNHILFYNIPHFACSHILSKEKKETFTASLVQYSQTRPQLVLTSSLTSHSRKKFLQKKSFPRFPFGCWQWCMVAGLTPASRSCNIISYWFLVDLPWSSHHSVMCSTRLLNEINSPPAKQKSNRILWELNAITEWVWGMFAG